MAATTASSLRDEVQIGSWVEYDDPVTGAPRRVQVVDVDRDGITHRGGRLDWGMPGLSLVDGPLPRSGTGDGEAERERTGGHGERS